MDAWTVAASLSCLAATYVLLWVLNRHRKHQLFRKHGIPGPKPDLLWGNWKQLKKDRIEVMDQWIKEYGKVFGYYVGETPHMVIADVEVIKQCYIKEMRTFHDRPRFIIDTEPFASGLLALQGEEWKRVRAILNPCFSAARMKMMMPIMNQCTDDFLDVLDGYAAKDSTLDISQLAQALSLDIISKCALAWKVNCQKDPHDPVLWAIRATFLQVENFAIQLGIASSALSAFFGRCYQFTKHGKVVDQIVENLKCVIATRKQGKIPRIPDMVQAMVDVHVETSKGGVDKPVGQQTTKLEERHIIANSFLFMAAGFDTTATALSFAVYCLAKFPDQQEKVYDELTKAIPSDADLTYENIQGLKYFDAMFNECLRMYPPVALFVARTCTKDITVMGHFIPEGTNIMVPTWHLHHDPHHWPDPWEFRPDRFLWDGEKYNSVAYQPFGLGHRICIGKRLAILELKIALCKLLRKYKVVLSESMSSPVKVVVPSITISPEGGIEVRLEGRGL